MLSVYRRVAGTLLANDWVASRVSLLPETLAGIDEIGLDWGVVGFASDWLS